MYTAGLVTDIFRGTLINVSPEPSLRSFAVLTAAEDAVEKLK
jgi:hypothetical protein